MVIGLREGYHESRRCSRDTYPESYITKYTSIRREHKVFNKDVSVPHTTIARFQAAAVLNRDGQKTVTRFSETLIREATSARIRCWNSLRKHHDLDRLVPATHCFTTN